MHNFSFSNKAIEAFEHNLVTLVADEPRRSVRRERAKPISQITKTECEHRALNAAGGRIKRA